MITPTLRATRRLIGVSTVGLLSLAACGSDDAGGSDEAFCTKLAAAAEADADMTDEESLALFKSLAASAPGAISEDFDTMVDLFTEFRDFDAANATADQMAEFEATMTDFSQASDNIEAYATENCPDLPDSVFGS